MSVCRKSRAPNADFQVIPFFYKELPNLDVQSPFMSQCIISKKWFKSLISKRTQLVRKKGKNLIALNAENPHKKSSKCIKMSEKKLFKVSFKVCRAWEHCRVVVLPGVEVGRGVHLHLHLLLHLHDVVFAKHAILQILTVQM